MSWLDVMPFIPVAKGVPLVQLHVAGPPITRGWVALGPDTCTLPSEESTYLGNANSVDHGFMRVDLDDPQGFAYALRWWSINHKAWDQGAQEQLLIWFYNWADGSPTDTDKLALAKAIAEVVR